MRKYSIIVGVMVLAYLSVAFVFAFLIDPAGAHPGTHIESLREYRAISDARGQKFAALKRGKRELLLFGSSRTWRGIDPSSVEADFASSYNAGVPGTNFEEIPFIVDHALQLQEPDAVVIEASLHMFKAGTPLAPEFSRSGFNPQRTLEDQLVHVLGIKPVSAAVAVLLRFARGEEAVRQTAENGTLLGFYAPPDFRRRFLISLRNDMRRPERLANFELDGDRVDALVRTVRQARDRGASVFVFFPPVHALFVEAMREVGAIDDYYALIRGVTETLDDEIRVQVWDMSAYYAVQREAVPTDGHSPMDNYADPSHFRMNVGDCVLATLFESRESRSECGEFGTRLSSQNVDEFLLRFEENRREYCEQNAEECAWIHQLRLQYAPHAVE